MPRGGRWKWQAGAAAGRSARKWLAEAGRGGGYLNGMRDVDLYAWILGIQAPWHVEGVELDKQNEEVRVLIRLKDGARCVCPTCKRVCQRYDARRRTWRHLDTCQFKTILDADVPRVTCEEHEEHGVVQTDVPWTDRRSSFTALMEAMVIG